MDQAHLAETGNIKPELEWKVPHPVQVRWRLCVLIVRSFIYDDSRFRPGP